VKHALTKVIFSKLYLDMRDTALVSHHDLTPGLGDLIEAEERSRTYYRDSDSLQGREGGTWDDRGWNDSRPLDVEGPALMIVPEQTYSAGPWWARVRVRLLWWS